MRLFRLFVATLCLVTFWPRAAPAQTGTGTLTVSNILWQDRPNKTLMSNTLNRADCLADVKATVTVAVRNVPASGGNTLEIWSGTGCDQQVNRAPTSTSRTCSKVRKEGLSPVDQTITIAFRDLIKAYGDDNEATEAVCDLNVASGLITRTLYYIIIDSSFNSKITTTPSWAFKYDIKGPPPPTGITASPGDETIITSFTAPPNEPNLLNYRFYCSPKSSTPVTVGGTTSTAGTDAGGTDAAVGGAESEDDGTGGTSGSGVVTDPNCQSATLIPGEDVPPGMSDCGRVGAVGAKGGETNPELINGEEFVIAVAAEDTVFNVGKLSNLACATPKDVRGFFESYRDAGGEAGGGYCSFAPARRGGTALLLAIGAGALVLRRRRS
jgi:hypothetical protein